MSYRSTARRPGFFRRLLGRDRPSTLSGSRSEWAAPDPAATEEPLAPAVQEADVSALPVPGPHAEAPPPPPPTAITGIASGSCPKCHVPYLPSGTTGRWGCPFCGRHATTVGVAAASRSPTEPAPAERPLERRHEELLAAWMMGGPLPCPRCRAALHHGTGGIFSCPSCGERTELGELSAAPSPGPRGPGEKRTVVQGPHQAVDIRR